MRPLSCSGSGTGRQRREAAEHTVRVSGRALTVCFLALEAALLSLAACASAPTRHPDDRPPVTWSLNVEEEVICATETPPPCELPRSTAERAVLATFTVHVQSAVPRHFKGTLTVGFFADNVPRTDAPIDLFSSDADVHSSLTGRVTTRPGSYTASVSVEETGGSLQRPIQHSFTVPVTVRDAPR